MVPHNWLQNMRSPRSATPTPTGRSSSIASRSLSVAASRTRRRSRRAAVRIRRWAGRFGCVTTTWCRWCSTGSPVANQTLCRYRLDAMRTVGSGHILSIVMRRCADLLPSAARACATGCGAVIGGVEHRCDADGLVSEAGSRSPSMGSCRNEPRILGQSIQIECVGFFRGDDQERRLQSHLLEVIAGDVSRLRSDAGRPRTDWIRPSRTTSQRHPFRRCPPADRLPTEAPDPTSTAPYVEDPLIREANGRCR